MKFLCARGQLKAWSNLIAVMELQQKNGLTFILYLFTSSSRSHTSGASSYHLPLGNACCFEALLGSFQWFARQPGGSPSSTRWAGRSPGYSLPQSHLLCTTLCCSPFRWAPLYQPSWWTCSPSANPSCIWSTVPRTRSWWCQRAVAQPRCKAPSPVGPHRWYLSQTHPRLTTYSNKPRFVSYKSGPFRKSQGSRQLHLCILLLWWNLLIPVHQKKSLFIFPWPLPVSVLKQRSSVLCKGCAWKV